MNHTVVGTHEYTFQWPHYKPGELVDLPIVVNGVLHSFRLPYNFGNGVSSLTVRVPEALL